MSDTQHTCMTLCNEHTTLYFVSNKTAVHVLQMISYQVREYNITIDSIHIAVPAHIRQMVAIIHHKSK